MSSTTVQASPITAGDRKGIVWNRSIRRENRFCAKGLSFWAGQYSAALYDMDPGGLRAGTYIPIARVSSRERIYRVYAKRCEENDSRRLHSLGTTGAWYFQLFHLWSCPGWYRRGHLSGHQRLPDWYCQYHTLWILNGRIRGLSNILRNTREIQGTRHI